MDFKTAQQVRDANVQRFMLCKLYTGGETFKSIEACSYLQMTADQSKRLMDYMFEQGLLEKTLDNNKATYVRKGSNMQSVDWRVDHDVYDLIDELERGW